MPTYLIPVVVLAVLLALLGLFIGLSRFRGGRYLRPIVAVLARLPLLRRLFVRLSRVALERQNPDLASAIRKLERAGATRDPQRAQRALGTLNAAERRAWLQAAGEQGAVPEPTNRADRRRRQRMR